MMQNPTTADLSVIIIREKRKRMIQYSLTVDIGASFGDRYEGTAAFAGMTTM
jgi:hypothetical protein